MHHTVMGFHTSTCESNGNRWNGNARMGCNRRAWWMTNDASHKKEHVLTMTCLRWFACWRYHKWCAHGSRAACVRKLEVYFWMLNKRPAVTLMTGSRCCPHEQPRRCSNDIWILDIDILILVGAQHFHNVKWLLTPVCVCDMWSVVVMSWHHWLSSL